MTLLQQLYDALSFKGIQRTYKIQFGVVPSGAISNSVIVLNPAYGERIGKYGSRPVKPDTAHYKSLQEKNEFYTKLEASILDEGFRNPIFCNSINEGTFCRYGTSRLWIAKKHKLDIPVIICDYINRWELEELKTEDEIRSKFKDQPQLLELNDEDMRFDQCPQTHLGE